MYMFEKIHVNLVIHVSYFSVDLIDLIYYE